MKSKEWIIAIEDGSLSQRYTEPINRYKVGDLILEYDDDCDELYPIAYVINIDNENKCVECEGILNSNNIVFEIISKLFCENMKLNNKLEKLKSVIDKQ